MKKQNYIMPVIEIVEIAVEKGFANSPSLENPEDGGTSDW